MSEILGLKDRVLVGWQNNEPDLAVSRFHLLADFLKPEFAISSLGFSVLTSIIARPHVN